MASPSAAEIRPCTCKMPEREFFRRNPPRPMWFLRACRITIRILTSGAESRAANPAASPRRARRGKMARKTTTMMTRRKTARVQGVPIIILWGSASANLHSNLLNSNSCSLMSTKMSNSKRKSIPKIQKTRTASTVAIAKKTTCSPSFKTTDRSLRRCQSLPMPPPNNR